MKKKSKYKNKNENLYKDFHLKKNRMIPSPILMLNIPKEIHIPDISLSNNNNNNIVDISISKDNNNTIVPNISQPSLINIPLFLHQLKSIEEMETLEKEKEISLNGIAYIHTKLGVLGDLPGYGKSLSVLGLIAKTKENYDRDSKYVVERSKHYDYVSMVKVEILPRIPTTLILVNISIISQWIQELNRTLLNYIAVSKPSEIDDIKNIEEYDVVLVSNNIYNIFSQVYHKKCWKRFVIDEPASLKLCMEETHATFYWLVTGTPNELYLKRRTGFLNNLLPDVENFDLFNHLIVKNDDNLVKNSYIMPPTKNIYYKCKGNISKLFEGLVADNVMEMIESCNISGVFNSLNNNDEKFNGELTIYDVYKIRKTKRLEEFDTENNKNLEKIKTIREHLTLFEKRLFRYIVQNKCIICQGYHTNPSVLSCCQQIFCGECIKESCLECPLCKTKKEDFIIIPLKVDKNQESDYKNYENTENNKTKIEYILDIIGDTKNKKILIFSNYNETFNIIKRFLDEKKLNYLELRGTKEKRDNTIDLYKSGDVNILLLNTIHSGAGLNLQETSDIILYHPIHEYQKIQVIGRANRIGRKIQLNVHYLE